MTTSNRKSLRKRARSSFKSFRKSIPIVTHNLDLIARLIKTPPVDDEEALEVSRRLDLIKHASLACREVRETVLTEVRLRREVAELRKYEEDTTTNDGLEIIFSDIATRRGLRSVEHIRIAATRNLVNSGMTIEDAERIVNLTIPPVPVTDTKSIEWTIRTQFDTMEDILEDGHEALQGALEGIKEGLECTLETPEDSKESQETITENMCEQTFTPDKVELP